MANVSNQCALGAYACKTTCSTCCTASRACRPAVAPSPSLPCNRCCWHQISAVVRRGLCSRARRCNVISANQRFGISGHYQPVDLLQQFLLTVGALLEESFHTAIEALVVFSGEVLGCKHHHGDRLPGVVLA